MKNSVAAEFLNLDLELESNRDLSALCDYFAKSSFILFSGRIAQGYRLAVEPLVRGMLSPSVNRCTNQFLRLVGALPPNLFKDWRACRLRVFDYGFEGGLKSVPLVVALRTAQLQKMAELGLSLRVTIYSHRDDDPEPDEFRPPRAGEG